MRCFVGTSLPTELADIAQFAREAIVTLDPGWRTEKWVSATNLHVTFAFLGDVGDESMTRLIDGLTHLSVPSFELGSPSLVAVPGARRAMMCWLEFLDAQGAGARLAAEIASVARDSGIAVEDSKTRFRPHATLVRSRRGRPFPREASRVVADRIEYGPRPTMSVPSVTVFTSTLAPAGPVYDSVATVILPAS